MSVGDVFFIKQHHFPLPHGKWSFEVNGACYHHLVRTVSLGGANLHMSEAGAIVVDTVEEVCALSMRRQHTSLCAHFLP